MDFLSAHPDQPYQFEGESGAETLLADLGVIMKANPLMYNDHYTHWIFAIKNDKKSYRIICLPKSRMLYEQAKVIFHQIEKGEAEMTLHEIFISHWRKN